ncbi:MAG TPA: hypothetical protein VD791_05040, partial [Burkholderiales bacterium]|nr:hypothetical protein [Burkholderiales bacterium]
EEADFPGATIHAACGLGPVYNLMQRPRDAIPLLERAWGLAEAGGFVYFGVVCLMHVADAYSLTGQDARAWDCAEHALKIADDADFPARKAWALYVRGRILARASDSDAAAAREAYQAALGGAGQLGLQPLVAHCHLGLGQIEARARERGKAREHLTTALSLYRAMQMQYWPGQVESALGAH